MARVIRSGEKPRVWPGKPNPLGATWDGLGVNFAIFSENGTKAELCLFENVNDTTESHRIELLEYTDHVFHCYLPDARPGQLYGYRIHGPWDPKAGHRFNPHKIVLDPYAKAIARPLKWHDAMFSYNIKSQSPDKDLELDVSFSNILSTQIPLYLLLFHTITGNKQQRQLAGNIIATKVLQATTEQQTLH